MRQARIILGIIILIFSIALLIWGFMPSPHETRTQPISPTELQLPTPVSILTQPLFVVLKTTVVAVFLTPSVRTHLPWRTVPGGATAVRTTEVVTTAF